MAKADAEGNLLVGLMALQLGLISRDALVDAVTAWAADRSEPLERILERRRAIDAETRTMLSTLARKRSETPEGRDAAPIVPSEVLDRVREGLVRLGDPEVDATLAWLTEGGPGGLDHDVTTAIAGTQGESSRPDEGRPAREPGRFRPLRLLATGGLGEVFVARDMQLHRDVALKQIQARHADESEIRLRFLLEAEVTGGLEHPGIVPIYGLGRYPDGRPYYAMRLVDGTSLKDAIRSFHADPTLAKDPGRRSLERRKLLSRFLDVCNTIAFAHSRGILHRDLKPGNVMLGRYGETLVVDWGLAKTFDPGAGPDPAWKSASGEGAAETLVGSPIGTPSYMSPEQAAGEVGRVGTASDVYSLGATLYCLLTGRAPFVGDDIILTIQKVRRGQFPGPQRVAEGLPSALAKICLKAMSHQPEARYPTPQALADDIEHWLAGEPVSVHRDWLPLRLWRWGRAHPWVARCLGIVSFVLIVLFLLSAFVFAIPGVLLAVVGGLVGSLAGAIRGKAGVGARLGSALAFRIGIAVGVILFVLGIAYEAFVLPRIMPRDAARPAITAADGYRVAADRQKLGDRDGARAWFAWAAAESRIATTPPADPADLERARAEAGAALGFGPR